MSFLLLLISSLQQNWRRGQGSFCLEERVMGKRGRREQAGGRKAQTMYAYMNKYINKPKN
jgi:hypothetical protein